ncbi:MAG: Ig-like domain-containing protein [Opitutaceae bacterium]|nr:Ig-like domain-containing protein [Opitutaceae bacterium]
MKTFFQRFGAGGALVVALLAATVARATPTITITSVTNGTTTVTTSGSSIPFSTSPTGISITVNTTIGSSPGGTQVSSVNFLVNGTSIGTVPGGAFGSYTFPAWLPATTGTFTLTAIVTDTSVVTTGTTPNLNTATSPGFAVTVPVTRTATVTAPAANLVIAQNSQIVVRGTATMSDGAIGGVEFFLRDGASVETTLGTANNLPYFQSATITAAPGAYTLVARATAASGAPPPPWESQPNYPITIAAQIGSPPVVSFFAPQTTDVITVGSPVAVTVSATDPDGFIPNTAPGGVAFYADGELIATDLTAPYSVTWVPSLAKTVTLIAVATDDKGNSRSATRIVTVLPSAATISLTNPPTTVAAGATVTLNAAATAGVGTTISQVQFYVDNNPIGAADTLAPYAVSWTPTTPGVFALTARATDSNGTTTTSAAATVTVTGTASTFAATLNLVGSAVIPSGSTRAVTVTGTGGTGVYNRAELYYDGTLISTDTSAPFNFLFTAPDALGSHFLIGRIIDSNGVSVSSAALPITVTSSIGVAPVAAIVTPSSGSFLAVNTATTITGTAADADGAITGVQVFVNGASLGTVIPSGPTWSIAWTPSTTGVASITAIATDNSGNAVAAPAVGVTVTDSSSPVITLALTPGTVAGGIATLPSGATRNIVANVTPATGRAVVRVEFFADGTKLGEDTTAPFTFRYTAPELAPGETSRSYVLSARATDNAGAARDVLQPVLVVSPIGQPPTVNLITPANGATAVPNTPVSFAAAATAPGGSIASVQFYVNGSPSGINPNLTAPYAGTFTPTAAGTYVVDAIATDDRGNTTVSNAATVTASFATPTVVFTAPNPNAVARGTPGVPLTLSASATVQTGAGASILLVEFLLDGVQIGADTTAPYSISWIPTTANLGLHVLTARVTDTNSQSATSPPLTLNVANVVGSPPTVSVVASPIPVGLGLQTASTVNFLATAVATGGSTLGNVEIYLNDISIGLAARERTTNVYRVAYDFSRFDFTSVTPTINDITGAVTYPVRLYAIARDSNNNQTVSSTTNLVINPATSSPPSIQLVALSPTNITVGTQFFIAANNSDSDGVVTTIQLFANGVPAGTFPNPQQGALLTYTPNNAGSFNLYAVATDDTGNTAVSSPSIVVNVTAVAAPSTTITRPTDNSTVTSVGAPVFLEGTAVNNATTQVPTLQFVATSSGGARQVINGIRVSNTSTSYRAIFTPLNPDTYTITTQASVGIVQGTSPISRRVVANNIIGLSPTVSITRAPGVTGFPSTATTASTADLAATATDPDGSIVSVEFFLDRNSIGQARRDPQGNTWRLTADFAGLLPGNIEIVALATDSSGNVVASPTGNINITAPSSIGPSITITLSTVNPAFNRAVQLRANARDSDGTVTSVQYFANATSIGTSTNAGSLFLTNWTPAESGTYLLWAVATDNSGITRVAETVEVNVRRNNPVLENAAFILQTYQDIANTTNINPLVFDQLDEQLGNGTLTRADIIVTPLTANGGLALTDLPGFQAPVNLLAAYYVLMGQWPTPQNYTTFLATARNNLGAAVGGILNANEYFAKYGFVPTTQILNTPTSPNNAAAFLARLHVAAGLPKVEPVNEVTFRSNNILSATRGRGYDVVGLNQALAEFITNTNSTNTALFDRARAAALFYQLARPPVTVSVDEITARIDALLRLPTRAAIADAVLKDVYYGYRFVTITRHPQSLAVTPRSGVIFSVEAQGAPPLAYQWLLNGAPVPGATNAILSLTNVDATRAGTYTVAITSNAATATSDRAVLTVVNTPSRLANISTRGVTTGGANALIGGFVVSGTNAAQTRQMLIRAVGPTLGGAPFNVPGVLANPRLELFAAGNSLTPVLVNDDWGQQTGGNQQVNQIQQAIQRAGAFAFAGPNSADAAVLVTLPPGPYTVIASPPVANPNASGIVLIEIYDVTQGAVTAAGPRASNVSTRGNVGTGANSLIAGFVVNGAVSRRMLIRGIGPTLTSFGVPGVLADPFITLTEQSTGRVIRTNDNWASGEDAGVIAQAAVSAGAFALGNASRDSAMIVMLAPGAYTVTLSGVNNGTGVGIVEVYDVDP